MNALTLGELIDTLVAARRAGGFRYDRQARVLAQQESAGFDGLLQLSGRKAPACSDVLDCRLQLPLLGLELIEIDGNVVDP